MKEYTPENVFATLHQAFAAHAIAVEKRFLQTETAMSELKDDVLRRIDAVDGRMDAFLERRGGTP